jgi:hypothetical protein
MNDTPPDPLDYEPPPRARFAWPPDWRRRLVVAAIAAVVVFGITFEAARQAQSSAVAYMAGSTINQMNVRRLQKAVDEHVAATGQAPVALSDVPEIAKEWAADPSGGRDTWGSPYQLVSRDGKATVVSLGRDRAPGGEGIDADIGAGMTGRSRLTVRQFMQLAPLRVVLMICAAAAGATALITFQAPAKSRNGPANLYALLLTAAITGGLAVVVSFFIAAVHAPSGH